MEQTRLGGRDNLELAAARLSFPASRPVPQLCFRARNGMTVKIEAIVQIAQ